VDAFGEIAVFVRVVERRSFTSAAGSLGLTASGVSRVVSRLEARLGVRLIERTTRSLGLTADGAEYYERCTRILRDLEEADVAIARSPRGTPRGRLRVDVPATLGRLVIAPAVPRFLDAYPDVSLTLSLRDQLIDPIAEGTDVLVRMAELRESELLHKKLGALASVVVASPAYLARHGRPASPDDLRKHATLGFVASGQPIVWRFGDGGPGSRFIPTGRLQTNSIDALRLAVLAGQGLASLLELHVRDDIARGALEVVLGDRPPAPITIHGLYSKQGATIPKVRAFLNFLEECVRKSVAPSTATGRIAR
jgi:DNA-binding transcriptional LysR family regulator